MSVVSKTATQGDDDIELLCTGAVRNYSFNPADLSGQRTSSKKAKLASNATSNAPGPTLSQDALLGEDLPQTDSPPDDTLLDSPPVSQSTSEDSGPSYVNSDSSGSESSPIMITDDKPEPSQLISSDSDSETN